MQHAEGQDAAAKHAPCILGMAITAAVVTSTTTAMADVGAASRHVATSERSASTARSALRCSVRLGDGAASLSTAGPDVPSMSKPHASCRLGQLQAVTNHCKQSSSATQAWHPSSALQQPLTSKENTAAAAMELDIATPLRMPSQWCSRAASGFRRPPYVAGVTGTEGNRLGFRTDPAQLDAGLQLGVVDPSAGCQLPIAVDATPVPLSGHRPDSHRGAASSSCTFAIHDRQTPMPPSNNRAAPDPSDGGGKTAGITVQCPNSNERAAALQGLQTKPVVFAARKSGLAAASLPQAAAAPVRSSSSLYRVGWEVSAASPPRPAVNSILHHPTLRMAMRTDSNTVLLRSRHENGAPFGHCGVTPL